MTAVVARILFHQALLAAAFAACSPVEAPANPSWDQDVFPILQGSCNHCHGELIGQDGNQKTPVTRLDVCDNEPFATNQISVAGVNAIGAAMYAGTFQMQIVTQMRQRRPAMPPAPASPLSDYERDVLLNWAKKAPGAVKAACAKKGRNRPPTAKATQKFEKDSLAVTLEVTDPDGDTVLGKVRAGSAPDQTIIASGRRTYFFQGLSVGSPVKVLLHDGYEKVELDL